MLRIIAGKYRGRKIEQPATDLTRPTVDRVKEAMFSMIDSLLRTQETSWPQVRALDLFAGSGALVLESISRGASFGLMIEPGAAAFKTIQKNIDTLKVGNDVQVLRKSALDLGLFSNTFKNDLPFSLIFLDPPYAFKELDVLLENLLKNQWASPNALFVFELSNEAATPTHPGLEILKERTFGRIKIVIARRQQIS